MADKHIDEGKGRLKQAAGSLTDDHSLKNEGKADQAKATVKDKVDKVVDTSRHATRSSTNAREVRSTRTKPWEVTCSQSSSSSSWSYC
jgi:uncharacterized protein YjbJ (UPF0337 family)